MVGVGGGLGMVGFVVEFSVEAVRGGRWGLAAVDGFGGGRGVGMGMMGGLWEGTGGGDFLEWGESLLGG